jgi:hypothetical protein
MVDPIVIKYVIQPRLVGHGSAVWAFHRDVGRWAVASNAAVLHSPNLKLVELDAR